MNNEIKIFEHEQFGSVRTILIDGQPWFVGKDVAIALGYTNPQKALRDHVDDEDLTVNESFTVNGTPARLINESGVYCLIIKSKLEAARQFKRWVTSEVLPSIRKYGMYATEQTIDNVLNGTEEAERLFTQLKEEKLRTRELKNENMRLAEENDSLAEVVDFINMYDDESDLLNVSDIAIAYQMSAIEFNRLLCILGIQHRAYGTWILAPEYENCGYVRTDKRPTFYGEGFFIHTRWTHKGAAFLYNRLKENGILPVFDWIKQITITN
ncbi:MAG: phage antirepressor [Oscillospiraceae bacterium]|nr:phage antirepressor [Oscillospiraceae bacterium]